MFWMWIKSQGRLPTYLLMGGSGLNVVHACSLSLLLFFLFFFGKRKEKIERKKMSTRYAYQWSDGFEFLDVLRRGLMDLKFGHASQRSNGFKIWTCFPEVRWFDFGRASQRSIEIEFGRASQRSDGSEFGRASQRSIEIEFWMCFPEV